MGEVHVPYPPGEVATCLQPCRQSMRASFIGAARRTVFTLVAVLPWVHSQGERGRGSGWGWVWVAMRSCVLSL